MADTLTESLYNYNIELKIKGEDYTTSLERIRLVTTLAIGYQVIEITLGLNSNDVILNSIYGQDPINLKINMIEQGDLTPSENIDVELMYLDSKSSMPIKPSMSEGKHFERSEFCMLVIPRKPYNSMWAQVNKKFDGKTPTEIIEDMSSEKTDCELVLDKEDKNTVRQAIMIKSKTLYQAVYYLDHDFGLYNGASAYFCQYDNKFYIMNLSKRMNKTQAFTVWHLTSDSEDTEDILKKASDGKNFYTYTPLTCDYSGNAIIASISKKSKVIFKPFDKLFETKEFDLLKDISKKYGFNFKNDEVLYNKELDTRINHIEDEAGYGDGEMSMSGLARQIIGMTTMKLTLGKDLPVLNLIKVGEPVMIKPGTEAYTDSSGKYLLKSSDIIFQKSTGGWTTSCDITLMRTNKTI